MLIGVLLYAALVAGDPITTAIENYKNIISYTVTLRSKSSNTSEIIKYYYKKPGLIRMEFVTPHNGAVLVYDPGKKEVQLRPFSFFKSFILNLKPDDYLIRSSKGHTVAESDIGALLKNVRELQKNGETEILGDEKIGESMATLVRVDGAGMESVDGVRRYRLWLDKKTFFPLKVQAYSTDDRLTEDVLMDDLKIDPELPENFFTIE